MKKDNFIIRFLLHFCKWNYQISYVTMKQYKFKEFFGKKHCITVHDLPPYHPNCNCNIEVI